MRIGGVWQLCAGKTGTSLPGEGSSFLNVLLDKDQAVIEVWADRWGDGKWEVRERLRIPGPEPAARGREPHGISTSPPPGP